MLTVAAPVFPGSHGFGAVMRATVLVCRHKGATVGCILGCLYKVRVNRYGRPATSLFLTGVSVSYFKDMVPYDDGLVQITLADVFHGQSSNDPNVLSIL